MRGSRRQQMWHICPALAIECYEEERQAARTAPLRPSFRRNNRARNPSQPFCPRVLGWYHDFNCNDYPIAAARLGGRAEECDPMELPQTGGCQCGAVRYEITQSPIIVYTCHCTDCQRMTSSAFSLGCVLPDGAFRQVQGEPTGDQRRTASGRVSGGPPKAPLTRARGARVPRHQAPANIREPMAGSPLKRAREQGSRRED